MTKYWLDFHDDPEDATASPEWEGLLERIVALDDLRQAGAVFSYPEALTPEEWAGLKAVSRSRSEHADRERARLEHEAKVRAWRDKVAGNR